jgi:hypothetical protein
LKVVQMSAISASFSSPFGNSGDLGVGTASILGANATSTPDASSVLSASEPQTGLYAALATSSALSAGSKATTEALGEGKLTTKQHTVLNALTGSPKLTGTLAWNTNGTEPTILTQLRQYGWIKLVSPNYNEKTRLVTGAQYTLTEVGKAISVRTGGSAISKASVNVKA